MPVQARIARDVGTEQHKISYSTNPTPNKSKAEEMVFSEIKLIFESVPSKLNGVQLKFSSIESQF